MKTQKNSKNNNNEVLINAIDINAINEQRYSCNMFEENVVNDHVVTIDNSKINKVDVMSMSRIDFFRKLVLSDTNFNTLALYDYRYYANNSDRSKSKKLEKYECKYNTCTNKDNKQASYNQACLNMNCANLQVSVAYVRDNRTKKQLADVLKETASINYLNKKYNSKTYFTVNQYIATVK